jgi:hypothetical protein
MEMVVWHDRTRHDVEGGVRVNFPAFFAASSNWRKLALDF